MLRKMVCWRDVYAQGELMSDDRHLQDILRSFQMFQTMIMATRLEAGL